MGDGSDIHSEAAPVLARTECPDGAAGKAEELENRWACAFYLRTLRRELIKASSAVGVAHPGLITAEDVEIMNGDLRGQRPCRCLWL